MYRTYFSTYLAQIKSCTIQLHQSHNFVKINMFCLHYATITNVSELLLCCPWLVTKLLTIVIIQIIKCIDFGVNQTSERHLWMGFPFQFQQVFIYIMTASFNAAELPSKNPRSSTGKECLKILYEFTEWRNTTKHGCMKWPVYFMAVDDLHDMLNLNNQ